MNDDERKSVFMEWFERYGSTVMKVSRAYTLTREECQAGMPRIYRGFDKIDADNKGYITKDDLDRCALLPRFPARISINPILPPAW